MIALPRQPLDRGDERALDLADRHLARTHRRAVAIDGARAAIAGAAPVFGAGEVGRVAQGPEQGCLGGHAVFDRPVVAGETGHATPSQVWFTGGYAGWGLEGRSGGKRGVTR